MKNKNLYYKILSLYQTIGGIAGIGLTIWIIITTQMQYFGQYFFTIIAFLLYSFSIFCGIALLKNKNKGLRFSLINQIIQLVNFSILGYGFKYISGFYISVGINLSNNNLLFKFGSSSWEILFNMESGISEAHINIFAFLLIIFIDRMMKMVSDNEYCKLDIERLKP